MYVAPASKVPIRLCCRCCSGVWYLVRSSAIYGLLSTSVVRGVLFGLVLDAGLFGVHLYERWRTDQDRRADEPGD
jgi:hypothetical protein